MPNDIIQSATWPGVLAVESCQYVCSHGISPGRALLVTYPQFALKPATYGNLTFTDGRRTVTIPGCMVESVDPQMTPSGTVYTLSILDERWQWPGFGGIGGHYNQKDDRQKLVPWTIRSPQELAQLCFAALGIENGLVQLPRGIPAAWGKDLNRYLKLGENFPQSLANPEMMWDHTPPAEALAMLADYFGCRIIYQPNSRRVLLVPPGKGLPLPSLAMETLGATVSKPAAPKAVGVFGAPVKIQARFVLEAVGREWHGGYLPIDQLSYAPVAADKVQITNIVKVTDQDGAGSGLAVFVSFVPAGEVLAVTVTATTSGGGTAAAKLAAVAAALNADAKFAANIKAVASADGVTLTGRNYNMFSVQVEEFSTGDPSPWATVDYTRAAGKGVNSWAHSHPPNFANVQETDRLSWMEAKALAQESVFKCFRILFRDPHDQSDRHAEKGRPLVLPWAGVLKRRQQVVLQETKVAQVVPQGRIPGGVNKANQPALGQQDIPGQGVLPEFYNGYSRDQANTVTGAVYLNLGTVNWLFGTVKGNKQLNTNPTDRVFSSFGVNQMEQLITFGEHVFFFNDDGTVREPDLTLEAGCFVLHPETSQVVRWEELLKVAGGEAPVQWVHREDVAVGVIGKYAENNRLTGYDFADLADAKARAGYYLRGQAAQFQLKGGETRGFIGIVVHDPDGYTQQVGWSVGGGGATTTVGANTEYHPAIPPYPARRRLENTPPAAQAAAVNLKERELYHEATPKEAK